ncbi:MAG: DNA alkylation repair protein [Hyphomicrobiales bacterium]|nr:DNA alkylation repair protein [Hyphomicrobiales bacterium]
MEPFKNNFSPELVRCFGSHLAKNVRLFNRAQFEQSILEKLENLELKARAQLIADHIHNVLPQDHKQRHAIILDMLHPDVDINSDQQSDDDGICGWGMMPLGLVVGQNGTGNFEQSLQLLKEMTKRFSSEFDVRYFLILDQERALELMKNWVNDPNRHVRRLVSEGTRPRLPWAMQLPRLIKDQSPILPLLESLRDDEEEYVQRSVANNLNDIAKDHPDLVVDIAQQWMRDASVNTVRLVRHALRSLIKQGHPGALKALGYGPPKISLLGFELLLPQVTLGDVLEFKLDIRSNTKTDQSLVIDYTVHHMRANGKTTPKVFKWKKLNLGGGSRFCGTKQHAIKPVTTRRCYAGRHRIDIKINGEIICGRNFELRLPKKGKPD